jgi:hypothetical protein
MAQVSHLDGLSEKHFEDVADNRRQESPEEVRADLAEAALLESYYKATGPRPDLVTNIWFGNSGAGHSAPDGHDGSAVTMPGEEWQHLVELADTSRREWRDAKGQKRQTAEERKMSGKLTKIYARLTPWLAVEAGKEITRQQAVTAVTQVAIEFQQETGRRVLAANIHIESNHDIHIHLTHTALVPVVSTENKYSDDYLTKLVTKQRKELRAAMLAKTGIKPLLKEVRAEQERQWALGLLENPNGTKAFYQQLVRPKSARRCLTSMNPAYCCKTALWEVDGRSARVAAVNEQFGHHFTFEAVVVEAARRAQLAESAKGTPTGPENIFIDYWLAKRWGNAINRELPHESQMRARDSAKDYVERYIRDGSSLPNPALEAARAKVAAETAARVVELDGREQAVTDGERKVNEGVRDLAQGKADLEDQVSKFEESKKDIERARAALREIPLDELCSKLGFFTDDEGNVRLDLSIGYGPVPHRILRTGQAFRLEMFSLGAQKWQAAGSGKGAIDLVVALPPKPSFTEACGKLADLFPDHLGGLTLEVLEHQAMQRNKQKDVIPQPSPPTKEEER